jgi:hypothetical protein
MLILQGERDYQVTMVDFAQWKSALALRNDVRMISYPKLNHLFMDGVGKSRPVEYTRPANVAQGVIEDIARWATGYAAERLRRTRSCPIQRAARTPRHRSRVLREEDAPTPNHPRCNAPPLRMMQGNESSRYAPSKLAASTGITWVYPARTGPTWFLGTAGQAR